MIIEASGRSHSDVKVKPRSETWIEEHGDFLYRFALSRVGNTEVAEDLVQECLIGALRNYESFKGDSSERTWLVSILKRRVVDYHRKASTTSDRVESVDLFNEKGRWANVPHDVRSCPEKLVLSDQLRSVFSCCLSKLPEQFAEAFTRREIEGQSTEQICEELKISQSNLSTRLYRARMMLRDCVDKRWFRGDE